MISIKEQNNKLKYDINILDTVKKCKEECNKKMKWNEFTLRLGYSKNKLHSVLGKNWS